MDGEILKKNLLGINGLGRIGKLSVWYHIKHRHFDGLVVNTGREAGRSFQDIVEHILHDSTYGSMSRFLYGLSREVEVTIDDPREGICRIDGVPLKVIRRDRNPRDIRWNDEGIRLVVDTTGAFTDPTEAPDASSKGSLRGHLEAGAQKVLVSAPFKIKDKSAQMPADASMLIFGINHTSFEPDRHHIVSAASCTTTGLAHMVKPLLETRETANILTASMSTIHAATNSQHVLDAVPKAGAGDLRKSRSVLNNIILSTTGAAQALEQVLPAIKQVGFMADSVRIPTSTVSLINLNATFHSPLDIHGEPKINSKFLNDIYREAAAGPQQGLLVFSEKQNVSTDLLGFPAALVLEGHDTHTRTGFIGLSAEMLEETGVHHRQPVQIPVTHAKLYGWYDNEYGSYVHCLGQLTEYVDKTMG
jgi:glyceraldehyde 3-phosphate dehydrogenase